MDSELKRELYANARQGHDAYLARKLDRMDEAQKKFAADLIKRYGIPYGTYAGKVFLEWLLERPRIARMPWLAKLLFRLSGALER